MFFKSIKLTTLILIMTSLSGCFSSNPKDIRAFLKPYDVNVTAENYILQPPDEIQTLCTKVTGTSVSGIHGQRQRIRPDGKISFEDIGDVEAAGKTPEQLAEILRLKLMEYYELTEESPIDVQIVAYQSKVYYVLGQVSAPGPRTYTGRDSFLIRWPG